MQTCHICDCFRLSLVSVIPCYSQNFILYCVQCKVILQLQVGIFRFVCIPQEPLLYFQIPLKETLDLFSIDFTVALGIQSFQVIECVRCLNYQYSVFVCFLLFGTPHAGTPDSVPESKIPSFPFSCQWQPRGLFQCLLQTRASTMTRLSGPQPFRQIYSIVFSPPLKVVLLSKQEGTASITGGT